MNTLSVISTAVALALVLGCNGGNGGGGSGGNAQTPPEDVPVVKPEPTKAPPQPKSAGEPPIVFEPTSIDFGLMAEGESRTGEVTIRNTGTDSIRIVRTVPSCACTFIKSVENTVLAPGEGVIMSASLTPKPGTGKKKEQVRVIVEGYTNYKVIDIHAEVVLAIRAQPAALEAYKVGNTGEVVISSLDDSIFSIIRAGGMEPQFVDFFAGDVPRSSYTLVWDLTGYTKDTMPWWWMIETDHDKVPLIDLRVQHQWTGNPKAPPRWIRGDSRILGGALAPGDTFEFTSKIKYNPKEKAPNQRPGVRAKTDAIAAQLVNFRAVGSDIEYTVRVTLLTADLGLLYEAIDVTSSDYTYSVVFIASVR